MKSKLKNLIESEEALVLLNEAAEFEKYFKANSFTKEEKEINEKRQKEMLRRVQEIMNGNESKQIEELTL